ncbi:MAG: TIM barrel protein [Sporichthyaceae bacterium]|nr:TIM barrel protein [Sporichthyaceae bacterium]
MPGTSEDTETGQSAGLVQRAAGAPISWGVSEVADWGVQLPARRVLTEMRELGLVATEFGPPGFLPASPNRRFFGAIRYGVEPIGGFFPLVLHDPTVDLAPQLTEIVTGIRESRAHVLVLAADLGRDGYESRSRLHPAAWRALLANLDLAARIAADHLVRMVFHPHVGTAVQRPDEIDRVLDGSGTMLCLDTGHVLAGGGDPAAIAASAADRIGHVHLKDADPELAVEVGEGRLGYADAVAAGLFRPLGRGGAAIAAVVQTLEATGYRGWYVLEQDVRLESEPAPGAGPVDAVRTSLDFLAGLQPDRPTNDDPED